jgi:hypothetical protein
MLLPLSLAALLSVIDVHGDGSCPAPAEVEAALQTLGTGASGSSRYVAQISELSEGLKLTLRSAEGELVASREVRTRADCSQRATAVAVVLAAWEAELAGAPQQAAVLPPPPVWNWRLGAEAVLAMTDHSGLGLLPGGAAVGQLWRDDSRWGGLARLGAAWPSRSPLASEHMVWMRPLVSLEAGPWFQLAEPGGGALQAEVAAGVSVLRVRGEGFTVDDSSTGVDLSLSPGLRWIFGSGALHPELALGGTFWLIPQKVRVTGFGQTRVLPQWEVRAAAGFLWGR